MILGSDNYRKNFIVNYFNNKNCKETVIDSTPYSFYQYSCDNEDQFGDFPDLNLSLEGKYNFTFNKNDLFKKVGNKYFFQIVFQVTQMNINYWRLGQLFFRKYPTFLSNDEDNSKFLYYSLNKGKKDENSKNTGLIIALSIVIPIIIIAIVIVVIYFYRKKNKKVDELISDKIEIEEEKNYALLNNNNNNNNN